MRIFEHPNTSHKWRCPVCGRADDKSVFLAAIEDARDGHVVEAVQVHVDCIELTLTTCPQNTSMLWCQFMPKGG